MLSYIDDGEPAALVRVTIDSLLSALHGDVEHVTFDASANFAC